MGDGVGAGVRVEVEDTAVEIGEVLSLGMSVVVVCLVSNGGGKVGTSGCVGVFGFSWGFFGSKDLEKILD